MSMTISSMVSTALLASTNGSSSTQAANADPVSNAFSKAGARIGEQLSSTNVQVSAFGQIKSGFSSLQTTGNALSGLSKTATADDVKKSAQAFVDAFNTTNKAISSSVSSTTGSLASNGRAVIAGSDLHQVLSGGSTAADLKKIGITVGKDGSLSLDSKAFDAATKNDLSATKGTLASLGAKASQVASKELTGNVATAVSALETRAKNLTSQQTAIANASSSILAAQQQNASFGGGSAKGISAYLNIFSS